MKKSILVLLLSALVFNGFAQDEDEKEEEEKVKGFKKDKLFTGGSVTASFFNGTTALGISPHFGYSLTRWLDVAVNINFNYISQRDNFEVGDKIRQTILGPGAFVRIFPVKFLFAQAQYEHNFIKQKYLPADGSFYQSEKTSYDLNSLLIGAGYTSGREPGENNFYYVSIMFDVLKLNGSPYTDNLGRTIPVIKAGYNIGLFQGGNRRRR